MAGTRIRMISEKKLPLSDIHEKIHFIEGVEQVFQQEFCFDGTAALLLVYEKFYFRISSYASLTLLLTEQGDRQTAHIITSGGGSGIANSSLGANRRLAVECTQTLEGCGFSVDAEHSDALPKSLVERFLK